MARDDRAGYRRATFRLAALVLILWLALGAGAVFAASYVENLAVLGVPVGYLLAALVAPFALVGLVFWFADRQDRIDHAFGMAEED